MKYVIDVLEDQIDWVNFISIENKKKHICTKKQDDCIAELKSAIEILKKHEPNDKETSDAGQ